MSETEFLAAANERLQEMSDLLRSSTDAGFQAKFAPVPEVSLAAANYRILFIQAGLWFEMEIVIDYGTFLATARPLRRLSDSLPYNPDSGLLTQVLQLLHDNVPTWIWHAFQGLPRICTFQGDRCSSGAFESAERKTLDRNFDGKTFEEFAVAACAELQTEVEQECRARLLSRIENMIAPRTAPPPWLRIESLDDLRISLSVNSNFSLVMTARYEGSLLKPQEICFQGPQMYLVFASHSPEEIREALASGFHDLLERAVPEIADAFPFCSVLPPAGDNTGNGFPPELWSFLLTGRAETPLCTLKSDIALFPSKTALRKNRKPTILALTPSDRIVILRNPTLAKQVRLGTHSIIQPEQQVLPDTLYGTLQFFYVAADCYQAMAFREKKPPLHFGMSKGELRSVLALDLHLQMPVESAERAWDSLLSFFRQAEEETWALAHEEEGRAKILAGLNPTVLAIIQFIYQEGSAWYQKIADELGPDLMTTKATIQDYLFDASNVKIPLKNTYVPLIDERYVRGYNYRHQQFLLYEAAHPKVNYPATSSRAWCRKAPGSAACD